VRLEPFPNSNKLRGARAIRTGIKLKLLDQLLQRADNQAPEYVTMATRKGPSGNALSEHACQSLVVVLARVVIARGRQIDQAGKIPAYLRQGLHRQIVSSAPDIVLLRLAFH